MQIKFEDDVERQKILDTLITSLNKVNLEVEKPFHEREQKYNPTINFKLAEKAACRDIKNRLVRLSLNRDNNQETNFVKLLYMYMTCSEYGQESWYEMPELRFSEKFYTHFYNEDESKLFYHYQYDNDKSNSNHLEIAKWFPGEFVYTPNPHVIDKNLAKNLLQKLKYRQAKNLDTFLLEESIMFEGILENVIDGKVVLVVKTYT
ncbi:MAG TPA: hypothetical protein VHK91_00345 [Flavisolibacter sp.]|nr:hypothetical protein [Flavisolibacter sp.]